MFRLSSRAALSIILVIGLFCAVILVGKGIAICLANKSDFEKNDQAIAKQTATLISTSESQQNMLNRLDKSAIANRYFEPFLLLVLGATLLAIGTSIKRLAGAEAKSPLSSGKSKRLL
jgi:hypothetical protein